MPLVYAGVCSHAPGITGRAEQADPEARDAFYRAFDAMRLRLVGAGNSVVVVDLLRCGPMLIRRVPNLVPIPGITGSTHCAFAPLEGP